MRFVKSSIVSAVALALSAMDASAAMVQLRVTVENLAPANSVSFAPLRFGIGQGTFDSFNNGQTASLFGQPSIATAPIVTIAEGGSGSTWLPAFAGADPTANIGSVTGSTGGPILPGTTNSSVFTVDTANRFFTFGTMVVPSNDLFLGNDNPQQFPIFDAAGNLSLSSFTQKAGAVWDAGSETQDPANAAFLVGGVNAQRVDENQPVSFNFGHLSAYNGLTTAAGYVFDSTLLSADSDIFRVSFAVVPEPTTLVFSALLCGMLIRRSRSVTR